MSDTTTDMIRGLVESLSDDGVSAVPDPSTDATEVIKSQLVEDTGAHLLDSGGAYGRHHEENRENPPWEQPAWNVDSGFVTHNVFHHMDRSLDRDADCVALEAALYAFGHSDDRKRQAWLRTEQDFVESLLAGELHRPALTALGLNGRTAETVLKVQSDLQTGRESPGEPMTANTYNGEWHGLSQVLQGVNFGGPYADFVALQVHGGADVRGGYTGPRVYRVWDSWVPTELSYYCPRCDWNGAESVIGYDHEDLLYQRTLDPAELYEELRERVPDHLRMEDVQDIVDDAIEEADSRDQSGAVFHLADGCGGVVHF